LALVHVPQNHGLSTADVYREADRIGSTRDRLDAGALRAQARAPLTDLAAGLENDLERAALSLRPELAAVLEALRAAGALAAGITGSGPTAYGVFATRADADQAAAGLQSNSLVTVTRHQPPAQ
ncbi:MAG: 4-diphosphocytidyl-2-C-methyl-D-erythritol kinase, partial [Thermoleophilales bacterium]|nr:4-diphosphocytidyl-2-C-methyl-D-erythritol kinase [Thermoleophilales bacterium]